VKRRKRVDIEYDTTNPPKHWKEEYTLIQEMRAAQKAPVDTMGCSVWQAPELPPAEGRYRTLVSLMLSSQTRDEVNADAMHKLIAHGLTIDNIINTDDETLDGLIGKCGFHKKKVQYIKRTSAILKEKFNSDVPDNMEDITSLPGVGPKMGFLLMTHAWKKPMGIGVDVHVHRITNRLQWVNTSNPEGTRKALEAWLPREYWSTNGINNLLVGVLNGNGGLTTC